MRASLRLPCSTSASVITQKTSVVSTMDAAGARIGEPHLDQNEPAEFTACFAGLPPPSRAVVEACWNRGKLHDELGPIDAMADVVLAQPFNLRLIACAKVKTDQLGARSQAPRTDGWRSNCTLAHRMRSAAAQTGSCPQAAGATPWIDSPNVSRRWPDGVLVSHTRLAQRG